jgi:transcriptional regulator with XRE-family HTH domain
VVAVMNGTELKKIRAILGLSQSGLALELGKSRCTVSRYEMPGGSRAYPIPKSTERHLNLLLTLTSRQRQNGVNP